MKRANPSPKQAREEASKMIAGSGQNSGELLAYFDPVTSSWRTRQVSLLSMEGEQYEEFAETWPNTFRITVEAGSKALLFRHPPLVPRTSATESSSSRTPAAADATGSHSGGQGRSLRTDVSKWPTPRAQDSYERRNRKTMERIVREGGDLTLSTAIKMWPTPRRSDYKGPGPSQTDNLVGRIKSMFPTPKATLSGPDYARGGRKESGGDDLATFVARYPTPQAHDWKSGTGYSHGDNPHTPQLRHLSGGQLSPTWVAWLMGFPLTWFHDSPEETIGEIYRSLGLAEKSPDEQIS